MANSAFIVCVPEAEARVAALRERFDASARAGVPAHVTVLFPFMAPRLIDDDVLVRAARAIAGVRPFEFVLARVARFPATAWLAPEPAAPFVALTERLLQEFPTFPPFAGEFGSIVPHLTIAHGGAADADLAEIELVAAMRLHGPVHATCTTVALMENSCGLWQARRTFALAGPAHPR